MNNFRLIIERHEEELSQLHINLWEKFRLRDKSALARRDWELAAKRFREYSSELNGLVDCCLVQGLDDDKQLRVFAFCFVACDPYYFRSGHTLERLLQKIKKLNLSDAEKLLVQELVLKRIDTKALRNFRNICRLIPIVETEGFSDEIGSRVRSKDPSVRHRAELAASYFPSSS